MRKMLYVIILALTCFAPVNRVDVAQLLPVEGVALYIDGIDVVLETDTQNTGRGATVAEALDNLKENTPAVVYLDTAEYLLIAENAWQYLQDLESVLKPSVKVSSCDARGRVKAVTEYLRVHPEYKTLKNLLSERKEI